MCFADFRVYRESEPEYLIESNLALLNQEALSTSAIRGNYAIGREVQGDEVIKAYAVCTGEAAAEVYEKFQQIGGIVEENEADYQSALEIEKKIKIEGTVEWSEI